MLRRFTQFQSATRRISDDILIYHGGEAAVPSRAHKDEDVEHKENYSRCRTGTARRRRL